MAVTREQILASLYKAYNTWRIETVAQNFTSPASLNLDGVRADPIKQALATDVQGELTHATQLGNRIKQLNGTVPGSQKLTMSQKTLQPLEDTTDVVSVIRGVLDAEEEAIVHYNSLIKLTDGTDYVTQDLAITILSDEEGHRQQFQGYLKEYLKK